MIDSHDGAAVATMPHAFAARRSRRVAQLSMLLALGCPFAVGAAPEGKAAVEAAARQLLEEQVSDAKGPGMAVLVARGDELLFRGARGMASIELDVPLRADHVFRIGSVTKQMSAAGLLALIDAGKVALDDPLSKFLPDYPNGANVTVLQLLNHTSGIQSYTGIPGYMAQEIRRDLDTAELVAVFKDHPAEFEPGGGWNYNNSGYVLVGAVIEQASDMAWDAWLEQSIFEPHGLAHTRGGATREVIPRHAEGYSLGGDGSVRTASMLSMTQPHAAGALVSTVDDLWLWNRALHGGRALSPESYRRMITPEGKAAENGNHYGFGITTDTVRGRLMYQHGGGIHGFLSQLLYVPEAGVTVAVLRNADGHGGEAVGMVARRLAAVALGDPYPDPTPVDVPLAELEAVQGVYRLDADNSRVLRVVDGKLTSQRSGGQPFELIPLGADRFLFGESLTWFVIERDAEGAPAAMRFFADGEGEGDVWPRTDEPLPTRKLIELPRAAQQRVTGQYASPELAFRVFIDEDAVLRIQIPGQPALVLKAESPSRFYITEADANFEFVPAEGPVQSVKVEQGPQRLELERTGD